MKYKKYIFFLLIIMVLGCNKIYAASVCEDENACYYISSEEDTFMCYNPDKKNITISLTPVNNGGGDPLINKKKNKIDKTTGIEVTAIGDECPKYLVYRYKDGFWFFNSEGIWGFDDKNSANKFASASNSVKNISAYVASRETENGEVITKDIYDKQLTEAFGGIGSTEVDKIDINGNVDCNELFGSKDDPNSIRYMINEILQYPKIIVPILVICFGTLDFAKAVIAGKEDDMKKAQKTFIKRIVIGVAFFFIPVIVDIIMGLADIVWEGLGYTSCNI